MRIGELAQRSGVAASAIRFYEARGLIRAAARRGNGYRDYPEQAVLALGIIGALRRAGFTLDELQAFVPADMRSWPHDELLRRLRQRIGEMQAAESRLRLSRERLEGVVDLIEQPEDEARSGPSDCLAKARSVLASVGPQPPAHGAEQNPP